MIFSKLTRKTSQFILVRSFSGSAKDAKIGLVGMGHVGEEKILLLDHEKPQSILYLLFNSILF